MAREKRKPKKDKKSKTEPELKQQEGEGQDEASDGSESDAPEDEEGLKPFEFYFCDVPDPQMSEEAKAEVATLIRRLRSGEKLSMPHSRPMSSIGPRCHELRVREGDGNWRVFYRVDPDVVVAVHVLWKTTQKTPDAIVDLCQKRFRQYDEALAAWKAEQKREAERKARTGRS